MSTSVKCSTARVCVGAPLLQCEDQQGDGVCVSPLCVCVRNMNLLVNVKKSAALMAELTDDP